MGLLVPESFISSLGRAYLSCESIGWIPLVTGPGDISPVNNSGPEVIFFSRSTQLNMKFILLINVKMPTSVGILIFISKINFILSSIQQKKNQN